MFIHIMTALLILTNFYMLGSSRLSPIITAVSAQAVILAAVTVISTDLSFVSPEFYLIAASLVIKSVVLPVMLKKALVRTGIRREITPVIGYSLSLLTGVLLFLVSVKGIKMLPFPEGVFNMTVSASVFTFFTGLFLIVGRVKAITQTIGYLSMENGIYLFGTLSAGGSSAIVELGILLDLFVGVFIMGIVILKIKREFDHIDTDELAVLRD